jgi:hypothetical protein
MEDTTNVKSRPDYKLVNKPSRISDLIETLNKFKDLYGDLEVNLYTGNSDLNQVAMVAVFDSMAVLM